MTNPDFGQLLCGFFSLVTRLKEKCAIDCCFFEPLFYGDVEIFDTPYIQQSRSKGKPRRASDFSFCRVIMRHAGMPFANPNKKILAQFARR